MKNAAKALAKKKHCAESECKSDAVSHGYCRLHYISHWRNKKDESKQKAEKRLDAYVDRLTKKYPKEYLEKIKEGLENEEKFKQSMEELEIESDGENPETEREYLEKFVRNIKGED